MAPVTLIKITKELFLIILREMFALEVKKLDSFETLNVVKAFSNMKTRTITKKLVI